MRHYVLPENYDGSGFISLSGEEARYLTRVLRKRPGDSFPGVDSAGNSVAILLKTAAQGQCLLEITKENAQTEATSKGQLLPAITLFQCIPKAAKMDLIIRQAVEAGVKRIVPIISEYVVPRFNAEAYKKKEDRWRRIARQAMQQCGSKVLPEIETPASIEQLPDIWREQANPSDVCIIFYEKPMAEKSLHQLLSSEPGSVGICIGPEGGFSQSEVETLLISGLQPVYINTNVLRTETAALYAIAAVQTVILEKDSWNISR